MLVAISGSQGSGKSTILNALAEQGFNCIERKTSRSILDEWGVTLQQVNDNGDITTRFQAEISDRKYADEKNAIESSDLWFTERTHADLFTYALVSLGKDDQYSAWLNHYYKKCLTYNQLYSSVYYLKAGHFAVEADGVRGSSAHYSRMVDLIMQDTTTNMINAGKFNAIDTPVLDQRVDTIVAQALSLQYNIKNHR